MPVYALSDDDYTFPPVELAEPDGLLAVGGDLQPQRIVHAYVMGIFPWYNEGQPILWWSPDPRLVLLPDELRIRRSLAKTIRKGLFEITFDRDFRAVITLCQTHHAQCNGGTWITHEMLEAYVALHEMGHAHSVEAWQSSRLVGGLYGVALGGAFCGESMVALVPEASKVAFVALVEQLKLWGFRLIDCQMKTPHLESFGAREVPRAEFIAMLHGAIRSGARWGG